MSHFAVEQPARPTMRRKSSAQNLLSSFKSNSNSSSTVSMTTGTVSSAPGMSFATALNGNTSTVSMPLNRESDIQSDTISGTTTLGGTVSPQLGQGTSVEYLRDLVQKRIITLTYVRNIHEGRSHWFHTIMISRAELDKEFNNNNPEMKRRTYRFAVLGMSLSNLLDFNQPQDFLRGLMNTITEYDQNKDDNDKSKMRLFRPRNSKRTGGGSFTEYPSSFVDVDTSYLVALHVPFLMDYHQTLLSLLDVLSEVYNKIYKLLGPSPFAHPSQHMMGPLGLLSPHPGVSYLFSTDNPPPNANANHLGPTIMSQYSHSNTSLPHPHHANASGEEMSSSLWSIANPGAGSVSSAMYGGALGSPPPVWTPALGEMVLKIDGKFKKITSLLLKELDTFARDGIKDELASLDPLLRNITVDDEGL
ncbi:hypothetical protein L208DRAFT_1286159 [Tricholoma matsutake]|nr:hypothetical protein L208DRAFT_1286159 [Tricholoma matsutake 945]